MRSNMKAQRLALSHEEVLTKSRHIIDKLCQANLITGKHIAVYLSYQHEVIAESLVPWLFQHNKQCYLPVLADTSLIFARYQADSALQPNRYGILEPIAPYELCAPEQLDTVIVPLVAFTPQCERLGTGAGFYDKTFAFMNQVPRPARPRLIGLAYEFQCVDELVQHAHDVKMDAVVTEERILFAPTRT